jgi:hypothetical protein
MDHSHMDHGNMGHDHGNIGGGGGMEEMCSMNVCPEQHCTLDSSPLAHLPPSPNQADTRLSTR